MAKRNPSQPTTSAAAVPPAPGDDRLSVKPHQLYTAFLSTWNLLAHVREGTAGFVDGTFLVAHPREWEDFDQPVPTRPTKKLTARRNLACYENIASSIIEAKSSSLFREVPSRRFGGSKDTEPTGHAASLQDWWEDVDGRGTDIDDYFQQHWDIAATFGHLWLYMDRPAGAAPATAADALRPFLRCYTPLDAVAWSVDGTGQIVRILFKEPGEEPNEWTYRLVTSEYWAHYDKTGMRIAGGQVDGQHRMGVCPVVQLFARRRPLYRHIGQSVLGDPKLYQDLYNLTSEIRELLRNQTFSFINIPLGTGDNATSVEAAKAMLGGSIGAMNVIFSALPAQILAGQAENVIVYHKEYDRRLRTIYRLAGVQWEADSRDAEAQGSLKLKREDMNTRLAQYADEIERADYAVAELFMRAHLGAEQGPRAYEDLKLEIRYPDTFDVTPFDMVLQQAQAALSLDYPMLVLNEILKALLTKFLPDIDDETKQKLTDAIDQRTDQATALDQIRSRLLQIAKSGNASAIAEANGQVPPGQLPASEGAAA